MKRTTHILFAIMVTASVLLCGAAHAQQKRMVGYIQSWEDPGSLDYDNLTHVCFSFLEPGLDGNGWAKRYENTQWNNLSKLVQLARRKNVKVLLAVGGWMPDSNDRSQSNLGWRFANERNTEKITRFVGQIAEVVDAMGLDGVDLDWEFPLTADAWNLVVAEFKEQIKDERGKLLTAAVAASVYYDRDADWYQGDTIGTTNDFDFISIMAYDWWGGSSYVWGTDQQNVWNSVWYWHDLRGVPLDRLNIGVNFAPVGNHYITTADHLKKADVIKGEGVGGLMMWSLDRSKPSSFTRDTNLVQKLNAKMNPPNPGTNPYAEGQAYSEGAIVLYHGSRYQAKRNTWSGIDPSSSWFWQRL